MTETIVVIPDTHTEVWAEIPDSPGYEISNQGNVRCWRPIPWNGPPPIEPRKVKRKINRGGYPYVHLGYKGPTPTIHRLVAEAFVPGREPGLEVAHSDGDKQNCRADNLRWTTRKDNHADKRKHGTWGRKLTEGQVREVREMYAQGDLTQNEIGTRFGITQATVSKLIRGDRWKGTND